MITLSLFVWSLALVVYVVLYRRIWQEYHWTYGNPLWQQAWICFAVAVTVLALRRTMLTWFPTIDSQPLFHIFNIWSQLIDATLLYVFVWRHGAVFHREISIMTEAKAIIRIDSHSMIWEWSPQTEALFGWTADEVVGKKTLMQTIMRPQDWEGHRYGMARFHATADKEKRLPRTFLVDACTKDGEHLRVSIRVMGDYTEAQGWQFSGVIQRLRKL